MQVQAVVFDFDGVILDTEMARFVSWQRIFELHGQVLPRDAWIRNIGRAEMVVDPYVLLAELVGHSLDHGTLQQLHEKYEWEIAEELPLLPGVADRVLEATELGIPIAVASSSSHRWVDGHLKRHGLFDAFTTTVCREDTKRHKPDPESYMLAVNRLGAVPVATVSIEDSPLGIAAARAAGLYSIGVACSLTLGLDLSAANRLVNNLTEVSFGMGIPA